MDKYNLEKIVKNLVDEAIVKEIMSLQLAVKLIEAVEQKALEMGSESKTLKQKIEKKKYIAE